MFGTLAFEAVRQEHHQAAQTPPFIFRAGQKLIDDHLSGIAKVAILRFPNGQGLGVIQTVAVLESEHCDLSKRTVEYLGRRLTGLELLKGHVGMAVLVIMQDGVAMTERAAACVLTYGAIDDKVGQLRGRALLIRALVLAERLVPATQLDLELKATLDRLMGRAEPPVWLESLQAHYHLAHAELEVAKNKHESGYDSIARAVQLFHSLGDWRNHGDASRLLQAIYNVMTEQTNKGP